MKSPSSLVALLLIPILAIGNLPLLYAQPFTPPGRSPANAPRHEGFPGRTPPRGMAAVVDPFAEIRALETQALRLQGEIPQLINQVYDCMNRELDKVARETELQGRIQREGRNILQRAVDRLLRRNQGDPRGPAARRPPPPEPSCFTAPQTQLRAKRDELQRIENQISERYENLYRAHPNDRTLTASIGLHEVGSCFRQNAFPSFKDIEGLEGCEGGLAENHLFFKYADAWGSGNLPAVFENLTKIAHQTYQCSSIEQGISFDAAYTVCTEKVFRRPQIQDAAKPEFLGGVFHPLLYLADPILFAGPISVVWLERHRREIAGSLGGSKLAALGLWLFDPRSNEMRQFNLCSEAGGCPWGGDFISSLRAKNLGLGDCFLVELAESAPIPGIGFVCDKGACLEPIARTEARGAMPDPNRVDVGRLPESPPESPFGIDLGELRAEICDQREDPRVPPIVPEGCGANMPPGYNPGNNTLSRCADASGGMTDYQGVKDNPLCKMGQASEGYQPGSDEWHYVNTGENRPPADTEIGREASGPEQERANNTAGAMERENSGFQPAVAQMAHATKQLTPTQEHYRAAANSVRNMRVYSSRTLPCDLGNPLACAAPHWDGERFSVTIHVRNGEVNDDTLFHEGAHAALMYTRADNARQMVARGEAPDFWTAYVYLTDYGYRGSEPWEVEHDAMREAFLEHGIPTGEEMRETRELILTIVGAVLIAAAAVEVGLIALVGLGVLQCGEEACESSCTGPEAKVVAFGECVRSAVQPPRPGDSGACDDVGPRDPRCPRGESGELGAPPLDMGCLNLGLINASSPLCWAVDCPPEQYAVAGAGGLCSCRTPGSVTGGPVGPLDCDDLGPPDPRCRRGGGGGPGAPGPGGGGFNPRGGPGGGGMPVIPGGANPAESP